LLLLGTWSPSQAHAEPVLSDPAAGAPSEQRRPFQLTKPPKLVRFAKADVANVAGLSGAVRLRLVIDERGGVEDVELLESAGELPDQAAMAAARAFLFEPGEIDNAPAKVAIEYRYEFADKQPTGGLRGQIRERSDGRPLPGVRVRLGNGESTVTDADGKFEFAGLTAGEVSISISAASVPETLTEETIELGRVLSVEYTLEAHVSKPNAPADAERDDFEVVVQLPKLQKQVVSTEIASEQARRVAGTSGDVVRVVENMPGVARVSAGSNQLVVWGAAPGDTRTYVEGVRIPMLYHSGGLRSVFLPGDVKNVELVPGGYGPSYGRGVGGIVAVTLTPLKATDDQGSKGWHGSVAADFIDAAAETTTDIGANTRVALSARHSYLDRLMPLVTSGVSDLYPIPRYSDVMLRLGYRLGPDSTLHAGMLYTNDSVRRSMRNVDPRLDRRQEQETSFGRAFATLVTRSSSGATTRLVPWVGFDSNRLSNVFSGVTTYLDASTAWIGLRAHHENPVNGWLNVNVGMDLELADSRLSRAGAMTLPSREGDVRTFGQSPSDQVSRDHWNVQFGSAAAYSDFDLHTLSGKLHVVPGIRFDPYVIAVDKRVPLEGDNPPRGLFQKSIGIEPRLSLRYSVDARVTFKMGVGRYHQPPAPEDLSATFGNPKLGPAGSTHLLGGVTTQLTERLSIDATAFRTWSDTMTVRNPASSPLAGEALVATGGGRSLGAQFLLRKELAARWFGWVAYSIVRSERRSGPDASWRLSDFDQTHSLTAVVSYDIGYGFDIGGRARVASGFPRTNVVGAYYDSRRDQYQPLFGEQNTTRVPMFFQLDMRLTKQFKSRAGEVDVYLDVQNVTNRKNAEEITYSADYGQKRSITGLPLLPILGASFKW
jgi:TonB family protein